MERHAFYDGKSALKQEVTLHFSFIGIDIKNDFGQNVSLWHFSDMSVVEEDAIDQRARVSNRKFPDARLVISGHAAIQTLKERLKRADSQAPRKTTAYKLLFAIPMAFALLIVAFTFYGPSINPFLLHFVPVEVDEFIGSSVFEELNEEMRFCQNTHAEAALQKIVLRLSEATNGKFEFRISVVRDKDVNAFALPGGHIVILSGLLREAQSPEEVGGILAHEMAHVMSRHGVASLIKQLGITGVLLLTTGDASHLLDFGSTLLAMRMSREQEAEADKVAAEILVKANISTTGFRTFFERLAKESEDRDGYEPLELLATHPRGSERAEALKDPPGFKKKPLLNKKEFQSLKDFCKASNS